MNKDQAYAEIKRVMVRVAAELPSWDRVTSAGSEGMVVALWRAALREADAAVRGRLPQDPKPAPLWDDLPE